MTDIFDKERFTKSLSEYYINVCGERDTDVWCEQPAVNVWVFKRDGKIITLKSDIRTTEITEYID